LDGAGGDLARRVRHDKQRWREACFGLQRVYREERIEKSDIRSKSRDDSTAYIPVII